MSDLNAQNEEMYLETGWQQPLWKRILLHAMLPILVLGGAAFFTMWLLQTAPRSRRRRRTRRVSVLVSVMKAKTVQERLQIDAMGTVIPAREVRLFPRVRGRVIRLSKELQPGGLFRRGRTLLRIDPSDYRLLFQQRKSEWQRAQANLKVEMGRQTIARREYKMLGKSIPQKNQDLVLRQPQLAVARAAVKIAKAAVNQANLNLRRTVIRAPFHSVVVSRNVNLGSQVSENTELARLVGTDEYWISLTVPVDQLRWFKIPSNTKEKGSVVRLYNREAWGSEIYRAGRIIRLNPSLEPQGRMARILVSVTDPLLLRKKKVSKKGWRRPQLLLGTYVQAKILGRELPSMVVLASKYVHNNKVWVMDDNDKLAIREISVMFRDEERVFISSGLKEGERVVTTLLSTPVEGMPLRLSSRGDSQRSKRRGGGKKEAKR
ncbi:MAG: efflux RND transporter periplasmic adaptor subunit [Deltaproteobacteria bacterium]|nr:MAG: efflux RND transporter periplasmic adaptor subunit [Deltaproteobacteria bacterium]